MKTSTDFTPATPVTLVGNQAAPAVKPASSSSNATDQSSGAEIRITEIRTLEELRACRSTWLSLLEKTVDADFFQTPYWLETYFQHFGSEQELRVLVISKGDQPTGILPLVIAPYNCSLGKFRVLTYPLDWWGTFYGPIGPDPQQTLRTGLEYLKQQPKDCLLYTSPSPRDGLLSRMPSSA